MRYISFLRPDGTPGFGRLESDGVVDMTGPGVLRSMKGALAAGLADGARFPDGKRYGLAEIRLLPVIPDPGRILCVGLNYARHIAEMEREQKSYPAVFTRWPSTLVAHGDAMVRPRESERFDYEGELAVVIGRPCRRVSEKAALDHVAGYSILNDGSVRDWQGHNIQFTPGKNFPQTAGFGPALVTADELPDLQAARVQTRLNGQLMQDQPVSDMIHSVAAIIAYCSIFTPLEPGDVIATGTPGGVGDRRTPPVYLKGGDVVEITIGSVGTLSNPVVVEA